MEECIITKASNGSTIDNNRYKNVSSNKINIKCRTVRQLTSSPNINDSTIEAKNIYHHYHILANISKVNNH